MRSTLGWRSWRDASASDRTPFRDDSLGAERLDDRALTLASQLAVDPRGRARSILPRFEDNARVLSRAYRTLAADVRAGRFVTSASEWLLDNYHLISIRIEDLRRNLPRAYYRQLPSLASDSARTRLYAMAVELVRHSDGRFERQQLETFLNSYQRVAPLTMGELWAWPSMLTLALIENLRRLADQIVVARDARADADDYLLKGDEGSPSAWPG